MRTFLKRIIRPEILIILVILAVAAYLRLYRISEYMTFLGDEGRDMLVMKRMIIDHKFTLLGPTASVGGFFLGPIYYYFMLPFVWAWGMDPSGAAVMVALFGVITVYAVYRLGRDVFGFRVGIIAAVLYALSPVVIAYSRSSWNPNLVPFFSTVLMYLLWRSVSKKEPKLLFWIGVVLGIGLQLHYLFLFLFPVVGVWYVLFGRSREWLRYYALGIAGFVIGYGPFLAFEVRHGFPNTISIVNFLREGEGTGLTPGKFWTTVLDVTYRLFGRLVFRFPPPERWNSLTEFAKRAWPLGTISAIIASVGLLVGSLMYAVKTAYLPKPRTKTKGFTAFGLVLMLLWFVIPVTLFGFYKKGIYDYYFGIFFPLPFILLAMVLGNMQRFRLLWIVSFAVLFGLIVLNWQGRPFLFPPNNQLAQARMIAKFAYDKTGGKPYNFALMASSNSDHAYRYFFELWGNAPVTIEFPEKDPSRSTVTDQLIVICELPECKPLGNPLWEIAGFGRAEIAEEWKVSFVTVQRLVHYEEAPSL